MPQPSTSSQRVGAVGLLPGDVDFGRGFGEGKIAGAEAHLEVALEERAHERRPSVPLRSAKLACSSTSRPSHWWNIGVCVCVAVAAVHLAQRDHAQRRLVLLHRSAPARRRYASAAGGHPRSRRCRASRAPDGAAGSSALRNCASRPRSPGRSLSSKPSRPKMSAMRSIVRLTGCSPPRPASIPGQRDVDAFPTPGGRAAQLRRAPCGAARARR